MKNFQSKIVKLFLFLSFSIISHNCILYTYFENRIIKENPLNINNNNRNIVFTPENYTIKNPDIKKYYYNDFDVFLFAEEWAQGNLAQCIILLHSSKIKIQSISFHSLKLIFHKKKNRIITFLPIGPNLSIEDNKMRIEYIKEENQYNTVIHIDIKKKEWPVSKKSLYLKKYSYTKTYKAEEIQERIKKDKKKIRKALQKKYFFNIGPKKSHPRDIHYITSPYWITRVKELYKRKNGKKIKLKTSKKIHRGLDLRGREGDIIYAMANGKIVLADEFFLEGMMTIIYHGNGIFSGYMHQSEIFVKVGSKVKAGQEIGLTGNTGSSTASHLHLFLYLQEYYLNPLSILSLPLIYF